MVEAPPVPDPGWTKVSRRRHICKGMGCLCAVDNIRNDNKRDNINTTRYEEIKITADSGAVDQILLEA